MCGGDCWIKKARYRLLKQSICDKYNLVLLFPRVNGSCCSRLLQRAGTKYATSGHVLALTASSSLIQIGVACSRATMLPGPCG